MLNVSNNTESFLPSKHTVPTSGRLLSMSEIIVWAVETIYKEQTMQHIHQSEYPNQNRTNI